MKPATRIRLALRLFPHLEDLIGLKQLEPQEALLLSNALTLWIRVQQIRITPSEPGEARAALYPRHTGQRTYRLQDRCAARTRLCVEEEGQPARSLQHVPVFCPWGFGTDNLAIRDTALAILADYFNEPLSKRTFVQGQGRACQYYPALIAFLRVHATQGVVHTHEITAMLSEYL